MSQQESQEFLSLLFPVDEAEMIQELEAIQEAEIEALQELEEGK